ncbi:toxin-antitoxin system HicB family antitoxin [Thiocapsa sp.]|uniref:toxin-antitoxin system HicB family antitoxin n=1 Tax=Thiocapsa sp. TaxID=2024551 RepID=UPI003459D3AE
MSSTGDCRARRGRHLGHGRQRRNAPKPIADRHYSGRFQVRITPELHRRLAIRAAEANVSLNRMVNDQLAKC